MPSIFSDEFWEKAFSESKHPRGQPDNAGQFAENPGGQKKRASPSAAASAAAVAGVRGVGTAKARRKKQSRQTGQERDTASAQGDEAEAERHERRLAFFTSPAWRKIVERALANEGELADAIGGFNLPDSEPSDVLVAHDADGKPIRTHQEIRDYLAKRAAAVETLARPDASWLERDDAQRLLAQKCIFIEVKTLLTQGGPGQIHMSSAAVARKKQWEQQYQVRWFTVALDDRRGKKNSGNRLYYRPDVGSVRLADMQTAKDFKHLQELIQ